MRELGGGVSNIVLLAEWPSDPARRWVVKQSLGRLRVEDDWRAGRERIFREAAAIELLRDVLGPASLPQILAVDRENYLCIMTAAPAGSEPWKTALLAGNVNCAVARRAAEILGKLMRAGARAPELRARFADRTAFDELRIDPYYRTTAARHPELRPAYDALIEDSLSIRTGLVHGDYSPKNMLVSDGDICLIDFEVVHWGDPAFDAGFWLNHLFLKALHLPRYAPRYFQAAREFWRTLTALTEGEDSTAFERMTLRHLGGLMMARIDGKSPVEYITDEATRRRVRALASRVLLDAIPTLEQAIQLAEIRS